MKLEIRSKAEKLNTLLNNQWVKEKKEIKRYLEKKMKREVQHAKTYEMKQ